MSDIKIPEEIAAWMIERNWGDHHDQWHFERRWDYWEAVEQIPGIPLDLKEWIQAKFKEANDKGWSRAEAQEGEDGNGEDFLFMHRAMIELLVYNFPHHMHYFRGWSTPPTDFTSILDSVSVPSPEPPRECNPKRRLICADLLHGIDRIENDHASFTYEDQFGLFIQTNSKPTADDPLGRTDEKGAGIHNYLHGRWADTSSELDLGDPRVNIFNTRFWRLHGWIDHQWWRYRDSIGADDRNSAYRAKIDFYKNMMEMKMHHHEFSAFVKSFRVTRSMNAFADVLSELD